MTVTSEDLRKWYEENPSSSLKSPYLQGPTLSFEGLGNGTEESEKPSLITTNVYETRNLDQRIILDFDLDISQSGSVAVTGSAHEQGGTLVPGLSTSARIIYPAANRTSSTPVQVAIWPTPITITGAILSWSNTSPVSTNINVFFYVDGILSESFVLPVTGSSGYETMVFNFARTLDSGETFFVRANTSSGTINQTGIVFTGTF